MRKKILPVFLLVAIGAVAFFSCKKVIVNTADVTHNYFPLQLGRSITYAVDSTYYFGPPGTEFHISMLMKYVITDTCTYLKKPSYIMDIYTSPYTGGPWGEPNSVVILTATADSLFYYQNGVEYIKMVFPVKNGETWLGNVHAEIQDSSLSYLQNWNYTYQNMGLSYFNGDVMFDHTVTVIEDNQNVNFQNVDSVVAGFFTYSEAVYADKVGLIYREITHYTFGPPDSVQNKNGYSVIMKAIDY